MKKKEKKGGITAFVTLFFVVAKLMKDYGKSGWTIEWVAVLGMALICYLIYRLAVKHGKSSRDEDVDTADETTAVSEASEVLQNPHQMPESTNELTENTEPAQQVVPAVQNLSRSKEQWKSLYQAGLITKKEYKQRLRQLSVDNESAVR
ncbi:MAG: hypothetical protein ACFWTN_05315 [Clostridium sp.]|jgi:uncharacterized membrane protein